MLDAPRLDNRSFQDLVDGAKRHIQEDLNWTDHNVSDPGVTLLEGCAYIVSHLVYQLDRVPNRLYVKFLELMGEQLRGPGAATTRLEFALTATHDERVVSVPEGTVVSARITAGTAPVEFSTVRPLRIPPVSLVAAGVRHRDGIAAWTRRALGTAAGFALTSEAPKVSVGTVTAAPLPGDALMIGLDRPVPFCVLELSVECTHAQATNAYPDDPPLVWEYSTVQDWTVDTAEPDSAPGVAELHWRPCEVDFDGTAGLNRAGSIRLRIGAGHDRLTVDGVDEDGSNRSHSCAWLRARVADIEWSELSEGFYRHAPRITDLVVDTVGGVVDAVNAAGVWDEHLGVSSGRSSQRFALANANVTTSIEPVLEVQEGDSWTRWTRVDHFGDSNEVDEHYVLDAANGIVCFGPQTRGPQTRGPQTPDPGVAHGRLQHGRVPPLDSAIRMRRYFHGGGDSGNLEPGSVTSLQRTLAFVGRVTNLDAASGGSDTESLAELMGRGPTLARTVDRAVSIDDYVQLAKKVAPGLGRVDVNDSEASTVRVLLMPQPPRNADGEISLAALNPSPIVFETVERVLRERRCAGTRLVVESPFFQGVSVEAQLRADLGVDPDDLAVRARRLLVEFLDPITGGRTGRGWPYGRDVQRMELFAELLRVPGCAGVEDDMRLYAVDLLDGGRRPCDVVKLDELTLPLAVGHRVIASSTGRQR